MKRTKTKYPGVFRLGPSKLEIRIKLTDPKTGKEKDIKRVVNECSVSAAVAIRERLRNEGLAAPESIGRVRLEDFATLWLASKLKSLKPSTADRYASTLDLHILPTLGQYYVDAIKPSDTRAWEARQEGKPATVNGRIRVLKTLLADAASELGLARSPAQRLRARRNRRAEDNPNRLRLEELAAVLDEFRHSEPRWYMLFLCLALTGVRFGEGTALRWKDIDFEAKLIHIRRSQWKQIVTDTKTGSSRTVPLLAPLATALRAHQKTSGGDWVFTNANGKLYHTTALQKPLRRVLKKVGINRRQTTHGLRRTFNNILRTHTSGDVVRSMTGHVTEAMTRHYSHVEESEKLEAADRAFSTLHIKVEDQVED